MEEKKIEETNKTLSREEIHAMMEQKRAEVRAAIVANFEKDGTLPIWPDYSAVRKFKSVRRAIRKGLVDLFTGTIYPKRPFSNKKPTRGRKMNELKKQIYGQLKGRAAYKRAV